MVAQERRRPDVFAKGFSQEVYDARDDDGPLFNRVENSSNSGIGLHTAGKHSSARQHGMP